MFLCALHRPQLRASHTLKRLCRNFYWRRNLELAYLNERLEGTPQITLLNGPPQSGKSALVRELIRDRGVNINALILNLRQGDYNTPGRLYETLLAKFPTFVREGCGLETPALAGRYLENDARLSGRLRSIEPILKRVSTLLPIWERRREKKLPVSLIVVDHASLLMNFADTSEGAITLRTFLDWLVSCSQELCKIHVILTNSDSRFPAWLNHWIGGNYSEVSLADMSRDESKLYFRALMDARPELAPASAYVKYILHFAGYRAYHINLFTEAIARKLRLNDSMGMMQLFRRTFAQRYAKFDDAFLTLPEQKHPYSGVDVYNFFRALHDKHERNVLTKYETHDMGINPNALAAMAAEGLIYVRSITEMRTADHDVTEELYGTVYQHAFPIDRRIVSDLMNHLELSGDRVVKSLKKTTDNMQLSESLMEKLKNFGRDKAEGGANVASRRTDAGVKSATRKTVHSRLDKIAEKRSVLESSWNEKAEKEPEIDAKASEASWSQEIPSSGDTILDEHLAPGFENLRIIGRTSADKEGDKTSEDEKSQIKFNRLEIQYKYY